MAIQPKEPEAIINDVFAQESEIPTKGLYSSRMAAGRHFRAQNRGCIVNVPSVGG